jgi:hypothetical protein
VVAIVGMPIEEEVRNVNNTLRGFKKLIVAVEN